MVSKVTYSNYWIIYMMKNQCEDELVNPLSLACIVLLQY
ncbi:hypothetical protein J2W47_006332 [Priestia megaterium]|nr:hypothetical protein [Priestia megaterium]